MKVWLKEFYTIRLSYENVSTFQSGTWKGLTVDQALNTLSDKEITELYNLYQC